MTPQGSHVQFRRALFVSPQDLLDSLDLATYGAPAFDKFSKVSALVYLIYKVTIEDFREFVASVQPLQ